MKTFFIYLRHDLFVLIFGRFLQIVIMLVTLRLSTNYLSPREMGMMYLIFALTGFFGYVFVGPLGHYINRKTHDWSEQKILYSKLYIVSIIVIALIILFTVFLNILNYFDILDIVNDIYIVSLIVFYVLFHTWNQIVIPMLNILEYRKIFIFFTLLTSLTSLIASYFLILFMGNKAIFWILGQITGYALVALLATFYLRRVIYHDIKKVLITTILSWANVKSKLLFIAPLIVVAICISMQTQVYRVIIEYNIGLEWLGYFGVGITVAMAIGSSFESVVMQYFHPIIYKSMNNEEEFQAIKNKILTKTIAIYLLMAIFTTYFSQYIVAILVDDKYHGVFSFLIFGIWIEFFRTSSGILSLNTHYANKTHLLILPNLIAGVFVMIGIYVVSKYFQAIDVLIPMVLLLSSIILFSLLFKSISKEIKIKINMSSIFNVLLYSLVFNLSFLINKDISSLAYAPFLIVTTFGIYFLFILIKITKEN